MKILRIFFRDLKVNVRDFLAIYILVFPLILGVAINLLTPSINNTTVNLAILQQEDETQGEYFRQFAKVEVFDTAEEVENRVARRDNIVGILPEGDDYYILRQGNEGKEVWEYAKFLLTLYEADAKVEDTNAEILDFGRTVSPFKKLLVNISILMTSILGGMLIALNIVEEKVDRTIRAIHLSPVSRWQYILGKSLIGVILSIYGAGVIVWMTGFTAINVGQMMVMVFVVTIISILVGFIQGLTNEDVMTAMGNIKILFLPMGAAVAAYELLGDKWQKFFYWVPFYWAYKGNNEVLLGTAEWGNILLYALYVIIITAGVCLYLAPKIKKGLE